MNMYKDLATIVFTRESIVIKNKPLRYPAEIIVE